MAKPKIVDRKAHALRETGTLCPYPEKVTDPLFASSNFFDARDLVQVKYEMVRRVRADRESVVKSAQAFGFSRPAFYQAQAILETEGLSGLVPKRRGPRRSHKLEPKVMEFLAQHLLEKPSQSSWELALLVHKRFKRKVHPRSIERALARLKKKPA